jgi:predicted small metal-binding protein
MTKSISCADVGADCNWSATAETEEELMKKVAEHAKEEHGGNPRTCCKNQIKHKRNLIL